MFKKITFWIGVFIAAGAISLFSIRFFSGPEDAWICQAGQWVKHGNPSTPAPATGCAVPAKKPTEKKETIDVQARYGKTQTNETRLNRPSANEVVKSPLKVSGEMPSSWYFEATAGLKLYDASGSLIIASPAQAVGEWMQPGLNVPFEAELLFDEPETPTGTLVLINDNPSGLAENEKSEIYQVRFWPTVKVFFNTNGAQVCEEMMPVNRFVRPTEAIARAALEELFKGPNELEKSRMYITMIPEGVQIQSLSIENGTAKVDLSEALEKGVGGSCRVTAIRAQIEQTLKQFSTVKKVVISINGRVDDILQP